MARRIKDKKVNLKLGVSLIIPVLNEKKTLSKIIEKCRKQKIVSQLIVVNDGSTDGTKELLNQIFTNSGNTKDNQTITVIHHKVNSGKGAAIKSGLRKASGKYVMVQDADLEYFPEDITKLYQKAEKSADGIVFGSRTRGKNKGYLLAQLGNWYLNTMFNLLFGLKLTDSYTCYKLMPRSVWLKLNLMSRGFEIDSELVAKLGVSKYEIQEIPISYNPRKYSDGKKIKWVDLIKATTAALGVKLRKIIHFF